jgi:preprotein translocase subunit SecG
MSGLYLILQIILAVIITACVLLQAQGSGLGSTWGGGGETYHTRRGVEKMVFYLTMICLALFVITSLLNISR